VNRIKLLLLIGLFILPVVAAYLAYYVWQPTSRKNYGELIKQVDVQAKGIGLNGEPMDVSNLKGKWVMVYVGGGACPKTCQDLLYYMRQTRTLQGKEMDRIERLWLLTDDVAPTAELQQAHAGLHYLKPSVSAATQFVGSETGAYLYMIDPLGHLMMRWPQNPEPSRMAKDIKLLLKASQIG
jgi:cytochrome oxidase Cu insertion factor (SCO1/SenC/PrrC family)